MADNPKIDPEILDLLQQEQQGALYQLNDPVETVVEKYLQERLLFYNGQYLQFTSIQLDYDISQLVRVINWLEVQVFRGNYDAVIDTGRKLLQHTEVSTYLKGIVSALLGLTYHDLGMFIQSIKYYLKAENLLENDPDYNLYRALSGLADVYTHLGRYDQAEKLLELCLIDTDIHQLYRGYIVHTHGILLYFRGQLDKAMDEFKKALQIFADYPNQHFQGRVFYSIAELYMALGDFQLSYQYLNRCEQIFLSLNNTRDTSFVYMLRGMLLVEENRYEQAIEAIDQAIILLQNVGNQQDLASCYQIKGEILSQQNKFDQAFEYFEQSLNIKTIIGNHTLIGTALYDLVLTSYQAGYVKRADHYFKKLSELFDTTDNITVKQQYQSLLAYRYKQGSRLRDKVKSIEIFTDMVSWSDLEYYIYIFVVINLSELLLDELRLFEKSETIEQLMGYISKIEYLASHNNHQQLFVKISILKSRLHLIQGNLQQSHEVLEKLSDLFEHSNDPHLQSLIEEERERFDREIESWRQAIKQGRSLADLVQVSQIQDYLHDIANRFNFD